MFLQGENLPFLHNFPRVANRVFGFAYVPPLVIIPETVQAGPGVDGLLHGGGQGAPNTLGGTPEQVVEAAASEAAHLRRDE